MTSTAGLIGSIATTAVLFSSAVDPAAHATGAAQTVPQCRADGASVTLADVPEASGLAVSRRHAGHLWVHNDGVPLLFAIDQQGTVKARVSVSGAKIQDWEAIAVGACGSASCVYVADVGDNNGKRKRISVYRFPEPSLSDPTVAVKESFHATYPDGAHDAETLLVASDGRVFVVTKGDTGAINLYRFPQALRDGEMHALERVGERSGEKPKNNERITDGTVSSDGQWVLLRTRQTMMFHRSAEFFAGNWRPAQTVDLTSIAEPQGEGVAIGSDGRVYLASEGGGKARPGILNRLTCKTIS